MLVVSRLHAMVHAPSSTISSRSRSSQMPAVSPVRACQLRSQPPGWRVARSSEAQCQAFCNIQLPSAQGTLSSQQAHLQASRFTQQAPISVSCDGTAAKRWHKSTREHTSPGTCCRRKQGSSCPCSHSPPAAQPLNPCPAVLPAPAHHPAAATAAQQRRRRRCHRCGGPAARGAAARACLAAASAALAAG